jgi:phosphatidylglycerol:prolipoprotein diacylglycerol transferase
MLATGFALAVYLARRWANQNNLDKGRMVDFGILMVIFGVVGSKILHVLADGHLQDYINVCVDPSKVDWHVDERECLALKGAWDAAANLCHPVKTNCLAWISGNGFAFYGGFVAAAVFSIWFIKKHKWPAGKICDMGGWTIMLGLAWGRMGCFLAGCCFGAITHTHAGVSFPKASPASRYQWENNFLDTYRHESLPVHPTQMYESIAAFLIAAIAYFVIRKYKKFDGQVFIFSMVAYAVARFILEFIRRDERGGLLGLSTSQLIAIGIVAACAHLYTVFKKKSAAKSAQ